MLYSNIFELFLAPFYQAFVIIVAAIVIVVAAAVL